jgi:hypothetical protein
MRRLAETAHKAFPETGAHNHIRDAARALDERKPAGVQRHLDAAMHQLTPSSIRRHGVWDDAGHTAAKRLMGDVHRHQLLARDVSDVPEPSARLANRFEGIELARRAVGL